MHLIHKVSIAHSSRPATQQPQTKVQQNHEVSIEHSSRPSKSPSLSQSGHFFLRLQQNLAEINKEEEVEEEIVVSDYPSGSPSVPRVFYT
jgi:hypothetical protein